MTNDMTDKTVTTGIAVSALLGAFVALVLSWIWLAAWSGYTLSVLWGWFVTPAFGLPALTVAQAYGVALMVRACKGPNIPKDKPKESFGATLAKVAILPPVWCGILLLVGWAAKQFI